MQVAILAGGLGMRLGDVTRTRPKSMVEIEGRPFLEYQLELLRKGGIEDVVLCIGHLGEQIERYFGDGSRFGVNLRYSRESQPLGTAGALRQAEGLLQDPFFVMYGDCYLFLDFAAVMDYFQSRDKLALMTVYRNQDRYDRSNTVIDGELVRGYSKQGKSEGMDYIDYGASIFRKEALGMIPPGRFSALEDILPRLIEAGEVLAFEVRERFYEIGSPQGLKEFEEYVRARK